MPTSSPPVSRATSPLPHPYVRLSHEDAAADLLLLRNQAEHVAITTQVAGVASHPEDDAVLATAVSGEADYLVTGDEAFRNRVGASYQGIRIISPREFLAILEAEQQDDSLP